MAVVLLETEIRAKVAECIEIAENFFGVSLEPIRIEFDLKGTCGGQYCAPREDRPERIRVNKTLAIENFSVYLSQTIPHEVAHYICRKVYGYTYRGKRVTSHGTYWKNIMTRVFGLKPERCHTYDTTNARVRHARSFAYRCDCKTWQLTAIRHNRVQKGASYSCPKCRCVLKRG